MFVEIDNAWLDIARELICAQQQSKEADHPSRSWSTGGFIAIYQFVQFIKNIGKESLKTMSGRGCIEEGGRGREERGEMRKKGWQQWRTSWMWQG